MGSNNKFKLPAKRREQLRQAKARSREKQKDLVAINISVTKGARDKLKTFVAEQGFQNYSDFIEALAAGRWHIDNKACQNSSENPEGLNRATLFKVDGEYDQKLKGSTEDFKQRSQAHVKKRQPSKKKSSTNKGSLTQSIEVGAPQYLKYPS